MRSPLYPLLDRRPFLYVSPVLSSRICDNTPSMELPMHPCELICSRTCNASTVPLEKCHYGLKIEVLIWYFECEFMGESQGKSLLPFRIALPK